MVADPSTWALLTASVKTWADQDFTDAQAQEFIAFGERVMNRMIFTPDREEAYSLTADAGTEALPSDFWGFKSGPWVDGSTDTPLTRVTPEQLRILFPTETPGDPSHFAIEGENILFRPVPSSSAVKGTYWKTIPALSGSATTNWLLTDHPDAYLAAALVEAFAFGMDEQRMSFWQGRFNAKVEEINRAGARRSANSGPLVASTTLGSVPNIQA